MNADGSFPTSRLQNETTNVAYLRARNPMKLETSFLWDKTSSSLVENCRRFGGLCCFLMYRRSRRLQNIKWLHVWGLETKERNGEAS